MAADADAARLLTTDQNFHLEHKVADILEADSMLMQPPPILGAYAVQHLGRVEGARHIARPLLSLQKPLQKHGKDLVRIDNIPMLIHSPDAVGIAVRNQPRIAAFGHDSNLRSL